MTKKSQPGLQLVREKAGYAPVFYTLHSVRFSGQFNQPCFFQVILSEFFVLVFCPNISKCHCRYSRILSNDPCKAESNFFFIAQNSFLTQKSFHFHTKKASTYKKAVYEIKCISTTFLKRVFGFKRLRPIIRIANNSGEKFAILRVSHIGFLCYLDSDKIFLQGEEVGSIYKLLCEDFVKFNV